MSRPLHVTALLAAIGLVWLGYEFSVWRTQKLALLEPPLAVAIANISPARPGALLLFGDSRVAQWHPLPARPYQVMREGFPGETAIRLASRFPSVLEQHRPQTVMIQLGINDAVAASLAGPARRKRALADSLAAIEKIAADSQRAGATPIILKVLPPVRPDIARRAVYRGNVVAYVAALNAAIPEIAARHGGMAADPLPVISDADGAVPGSYRRDALHLTSHAYQALGVLLPLSLEAGN